MSKDISVEDILGLNKQSIDSTLKNRKSNLSSCKIIELKSIRYSSSSIRSRILNECTIMSIDDNQTFILYFDTNKSDRHLKVPVGFFYGRLCGK
jgi:hypothetical protein